MPIVLPGDPANYGTSAWDMRDTLRFAHLNPQNIPFIFDLTRSGVHGTAFGDFLVAAGKGVEKILYRNVLIGESANITDDEAFWNLIGNIGLQELPAWKIRGRSLATDDFKASVDEISRLPKLVSPSDLVRAIDHFIWISHLREHPKHIAEIVNGWDAFRKNAAGHPMFEPLIEHGYFMSEIADNGLQAVIENFMTKKITREEIKIVLDLHERMASTFGENPRTAEIWSILEKYRGWMRPIIINYRRLSDDVVSDRRRQFNRFDIQDDGTRAHFLHGLNDPEILMALYRLGLPLQKIKALRNHLDFGQMPHEPKTNPNAITVEHMTPLTTGETWVDNLALSTARANEDMNKLVKLQTDFLPGDEVERGPNGSIAVWKKLGATVAIVAMRPPYVTYGKDKKMPSLMRHDGWKL